MPRNSLYIITGLPAVGKTTFAKDLAKQTRACLIDIDTASEAIVQAAMAKITGNTDDRDSPVFKTTFRVPIYQTLLALADANLAHTSVIITGPFSKELENRNWLDELKDSLQTECHIKCIYLTCDESIRKQRLMQRGNPRDKAKLESWNEHMVYYGRISMPSCPHILLDTGQAYASDLTALLKDPT